MKKKFYVIGEKCRDKVNWFYWFVRKKDAKNFLQSRKSLMPPKSKIYKVTTVRTFTEVK